MIRIRNTKIIEFNLLNKTATIHLTHRKSIDVDANTKFMHQYATGWSGWGIKKEKEENLIYVSARVMRQIGKYLEFYSQDTFFDYFKMPFDKYFRK